MTNFKSTIGSVPTRRRFATVVAVIGTAFVGSQLANAWPREVQTIYEVGPEVEELDVDYLEGGQAVASVRFARASSKTGVFRHLVRLQPGEYQIHITLYGRNGAATQQTRRLVVPTEGVTRFELKAATGPSE